MKKQISTPVDNNNIITEHAFTFFLKSKYRHLNMNQLLTEVFGKKDSTISNNLKLKQ